LSIKSADYAFNYDAEPSLTAAPSTPVAERTVKIPATEPVL
jgi:hypothetical protein